jgi:hypothetical protein
MAWVPDRLREVANQVADGNRPVVSVRTLLSWFGSQRRGRFIMVLIREALAELHLHTEPDVNWTYLDGQIKFFPDPPEKNQIEDSGQPSELSLQTTDTMHLVDAVVVTAHPTSVDPTFRIGRLELANRPPTAVHPDTEILSAVTIMLMNNFSQLPVLVHERQIKGMISWRSLGSRLSQGQSPKTRSYGRLSRN